ncbi:hypothetical protein MNBD_GAMMA18-2157 [hydrothermal vent metagenome]|uniref:Uncharacterized protein n=1 Tax=hydrothermal vent metagenome TaxID=652676 RepID=A0A3B0Z9M3_9ZZZZ
MDNDTKIFTRRDLHELSKENTVLKKLMEDFKAYKKGFSIECFGRDAPLHRPKPSAELAELMHVHLLSNPKSQIINVAKITDPYRLTSDSFLIYTRGFFNGNYHYIIDYIENDAHKKVENMKYMRWLIEQAEYFRSSK